MTISVEEISRRFDISLAAARVRASELERCERQRVGQARPLPRGVVEFLRNQKKMGFYVRSIDLEGK